MVEQKVINLGRVKQDAEVPVEWKLTIPESDIVHMVVDCKCTADVKVEDGKIKALFKEDEAQQLNDEQKKKWYPEGYLPISKGITVYLNDGKNLVTFDGNGNQQFNPEKKQERIQFIGEVEYA